MSGSTLPPPRTSSRAISYSNAPPSYPYFRDEYLVPLKPLIFHDTDLFHDWPACARWTTELEDGNLQPYIDALAADFAGHEVSVIVSEPGSPDTYGDDGRRTMAFEEFAALWKDRADKRIYLKDYHLCLARPHDCMYRTYDLFQDDWMNAYALHTTSDDYRFLYLGTSGTTTAFHHDVYLSHSWSTSLCGVKRWVLLDPAHAYLLRHRTTQELVPDLFDVAVPEDYPGLFEARTKALVVWQYPNETMFVPSGWHHSVTNYGLTLSINHNWANASCISGMYSALAEETRHATELLSDLRPSATAPSDEHAEFFGLVYNNMCRPSWGWSFEDFWALTEWMVDNPDGGKAWTIPLNACLSVRHQETRSQLCSLAEQWLGREEAIHLPALAKKVRRVVATLGNPASGDHDIV